MTVDSIVDTVDIGCLQVASGLTLHCWYAHASFVSDSTMFACLFVCQLHMSPPHVSDTERGRPNF